MSVENEVESRMSKNAIRKIDRLRRYIKRNESDISFALYTIERKKIEIETYKQKIVNIYLR